MTPTVRPLSLRELGVLLGRMHESPRPWAKRRSLRWLMALHRDTGKRVMWRTPRGWATTLAAIRDAMPGLGEKLATVADVDDLGERVEALEESHASLSGDVTTLAETLERVARRVAALESGTRAVGQPGTGVRAKLGA